MRCLMGKDSGIEWTHHTFNPWWGCTRVSPGCEHCYAETFAKRVGVQWGVKAERRFFGDKHWAEPLKWNAAAKKSGERHRVFCASMADVFEDRRDLDEVSLRLWALIEATPNLDWLLLTKRPENIERLEPESWNKRWPANAWAGTTVEDRLRVEKRIPYLLRVPTTVRFLSCEPLLEGIDISFWLRRYLLHAKDGRWMHNTYPEAGTTGGTWLRGIDWVIVGGESGHGARPMHPDWARSLRDQCVAAGVALHFKQWGNWAEIPYDRQSPPGDRPQERYLNAAGGHGFHGDQVIRIRTAHKKTNGRELDGRTWDEFPMV